MSILSLVSLSLKRFLETWYNNGHSGLVTDIPKLTSEIWHGEILLERSTLICNKCDLSQDVLIQYELYKVLKRRPNVNTFKNWSSDGCLVESSGSTDRGSKKSYENRFESKFSCKCGKKKKKEKNWQPRNFSWNLKMQKAISQIKEKYFHTKIRCQPFKCSKWHIFFSLRQFVMWR